MAYNFDLAKKYGITNEQIEGYLTNKGQQVQQPAGISREPKTTIGEKIGGFLGMEPFAKGIGLSLFQLTPEHKMLTQMAMRGEVTPEEYEKITIGGLTTKQVLGSAAMTALNIGLAGFKAPLKAIARIPAHAALGGAFAAAGAAARGEEITPGAVATGALIGAAVPEIFRGVGNMLNKLTNKLPARLMNSAVKPVNPKLGQQLVDRGLIGNEETLLKKSLDQISTNEFKLDEFLSNKRGEIKTSDILKILEPLKEKYKNSPKILQLIEKETNDWIVQSTYTPIEANVQKRILYETVGDRAYRAGIQHKAQTDVLKTLARGFKESIEVIVPEVKPINIELGVYLEARNALVKRIAAVSKQQLGIWGDIIIGSGGGIFAGLPGGLAAVTVRRGAEAAITKTGLAVGLSRLGTLIEKIPTDAVGKISKAALMNLIAQIKEE